MAAYGMGNIIVPPERASPLIGMGVTDPHTEVKNTDNGGHIVTYQGSNSAGNNFDLSVELSKDLSLVQAELKTDGKTTWEINAGESMSQGRRVTAIKLGSSAANYILNHPEQGIAPVAPPIQAPMLAP